MTRITQQNLESNLWGAAVPAHLCGKTAQKRTECTRTFISLEERIAPQTFRGFLPIRRC
jgi:hypothetical protein